MPECTECGTTIQCYTPSVPDHDPHIHISRVPGGKEPDVESWAFCSDECFQEWSGTR